MKVEDIYAVGDDALAVRAPESARRHALVSAFRHSGRWLDVVPGKQNVTVFFDPLSLAPGEARQALQSALTGASAMIAGEAETITLHMRADAASAPDLGAVSARNGVSETILLERLSQSDLQVDMMGFVAGFAYVDGVDPSLQASRLPSPRQTVPAGSVGMLTGQLGFYALAGPAGWPIIGQVTERLFERSDARPFRLATGMKIRLVIER